MRLAGTLTYLQRRNARRAARAYVAAQYAADVEALRNLELRIEEIHRERQPEARAALPLQHEG